MFYPSIYIYIYIYLIHKWNIFRLAKCPLIVEINGAGWVRTDIYSVERCFSSYPCFGSAVPQFISSSSLRATFHHGGVCLALKTRSYQDVLLSAGRRGRKSAETLLSPCISKEKRMCAPGGLYSTDGKYVRDESSSSLHQGYSHLSRFESGEKNIR